MSKIKYEMKSVTTKQVKVSRSIFDPIIDEFIKSDNRLVELTTEAKSPGYMKTSLVKRLVKREITNIEVTLGYGVIYLEKTEST